MKRTLILIFLASLGVSGCSSLDETPRGIGYDMDALKTSACPCGKVFYRNGVRI